MHIAVIVILSILAAYWLLSLILLLFPGLVHNKRHTFAKQRFWVKNRIAIFSHRGGSMEAFENSIPAFKNSLDLGITGLELDVHRTKDGHIIIAHDSNLHRVTGQFQAISDTYYDDISPFVNETDGGFGKYIFPNGNTSEKPPLLRDLFELAQGSNVLFSIDVKTLNEVDIRAVLDIAKEYNLLDRIIIGGVVAKIDPKKYIAEYGPQVNFFFPAQTAFMTFLFFLVGLLPFIPLKYDFYIVTFAFKTMRQTSFARNSKLISAFFFILYLLWPFKKLMNWHLKRRGIIVIYWILNNEEDYAFALKLGAQGLMGDKPSNIKQYLVSKSLF